jgi:membrane protein DedA with SNARE-associated domain
VDIAGTGLLAILGLILVKEAGLPIPVPGDLVVIATGVAAGQGEFDPASALVALIAVSVVGGVIQFGLLRSVARPVALRLLSRFASAERLEAQTERLRRGGVRSVAIARSTPGIRIVAIAASAIAGLPAAVFIIGLVLGNALFIAAHFALGYVLGEPILSTVGGALGPLAIAGVVLAVVGAAGWVVLDRRRRGSTARPVLRTLADWSDACCPACLAVAAVDVGRAGRIEAGRGSTGERPT